MFLLSKNIKMRLKNLMDCIKLDTTIYVMTKTNGKVIVFVCVRASEGMLERHKIILCIRKKTFVFCDVKTCASNIKQCLCLEIVNRSSETDESDSLHFTYICLDKVSQNKRRSILFFFIF